jgi:DNA-binding transcriptional ArsR family regulator
LASRLQEEKGDSYRELDLPPGSLSGYPLNLNSLRSLAEKSWARLDANAWLEALVSEVLVTHQRIAIRKMGQSGEDTLMFRSSDLGYFVHREMKRIVKTQPRLRQALQILRDLGLTTSEAGHLPRLTPLGLSILEEMET